MVTVYDSGGPAWSPKVPGTEGGPKAPEYLMPRCQCDFGASGVGLDLRQRLHFARFTRSSKEPWFCTDTTPAMLGALMA
jgi:hypothetical protein